MPKTTNPKTANAKAGAKRGRKAKVPVLPVPADAAPEVGATVATEPVTATTEATIETAKLSGLDAAALVLREAGVPMNAQDLVARILERGLWTTDGKTPAATIYAAMIREIKVKGDKARFAKVDRGRFAAAG